MKKELQNIDEVVCQMNGMIDARIRFFIGSAIKDALALGRRTELLTACEAQALLDIVEEDVMTEARDDENVRAILARIQRQAISERGEDDELADPDECNMTPKLYYDVFIKPALNIISEEFQERFGPLFVKYICTGESPAEDALNEDEKLLWNVFMMMVEIKFNPEFSAFISEANEGE